MGAASGCSHFLAATHPAAKGNTPARRTSSAQHAGNVLLGDDHAPPDRLQAGFEPRPAYPLAGSAGVKAVREKNLAFARAVKNHPVVVLKSQKITFDADQDWVSLADLRVHDTLGQRTRDPAFEAEPPQGGADLRRATSLIGIRVAVFPQTASGGRSWAEVVEDAVGGGEAAAPAIELAPPPERQHKLASLGLDDFGIWRGDRKQPAQAPHEGLHLPFHPPGGFRLVFIFVR